MVREIEKQMEGVEVLGKRAICEQDPEDRPAAGPRRSPAPRFHAVAPEVRRMLEIGYHLTLVAYRRAVENLRSGKKAQFPAGCFVPGRFIPLRT